LPLQQLIEANIEALQRGAQLLLRIDDATYQQRLGTVFNGSIGAHVRHNLDFYLSLLDGLPGADIDYEQRRRDPVIEVDRASAVDLITQICERLRHTREPAGTLQVRVSARAGSSAAGAVTSLSRELDSLLSHTIHHYAIVAIMCRLSGVRVDEQFGVAPSTLRYWASLGPVRAGSGRSMS
jgi:hypothetical protein